MSPAPGPERPDSNKTLMRQRDIFRTAAENSTGAGKPKFERLSRAFNAMQDTAEAGGGFRFEFARMEFRTAMADVQQFAKIDADTSRVLQELADALDKEEKGGNISPKAADPKTPVPKAPEPKTPEPKEPEPKKKSKSKHWNI